MKGRFKRPNILLPIIAIVIVGMVLGAAFFVAVMPAPERISLDDLFKDDEYRTGVPLEESSDAGGTIYVETTLKDEHGTVIRRTFPDIMPSPYAIVDPDTELEVTSYNVGIQYEAWGQNIDWATFHFTGTWTYTKYIGITDYGTTWPDDKNQVLDTIDFTGTVVDPGNGRDETNGDVSFGEVDVASLMPDYIYHTESEGFGEVYHYEWPQKTAESHAMNFIFDCDFMISVDDDWGNQYDSEYNLHIVLTLLWSGSDFEVTWNPEVGTVTTTEPTTTPTTDPELPPTPPKPPIDPRDDVNPTSTQSDEKSYLTSTGGDDVLAMSLTGAQGSLLAAVGAMTVVFVIVVVLWIRKGKR